MPNYRRWRQPGGVYFFTVVTYERRPILVWPIFRAALRQAWEATRADRPFDTLAVTLLPDHLHCLWRLPDGDDEYSVRWRMIKTRVTQTVGAREVPVASSRERRNEGSVWQRRFWEHVIRDEADLKRHADYIHYNPVKHGHVARSADWPYSSFQRYVRLGEYDVDWGKAEPETLSGWPGPRE